MKNNKYLISLIIYLIVFLILFFMIFFVYNLLDLNLYNKMNKLQDNTSKAHIIIVMSNCDYVFRKEYHEVKSINMNMACNFLLIF
jgi:hypothetical protein